MSHHQKHKTLNIRRGCGSSLHMFICIYIMPYIYIIQIYMCHIVKINVFLELVCYIAGFIYDLWMKLIRAQGPWKCKTTDYHLSMCLCYGRFNADIFFLYTYMRSKPSIWSFFFLPLYWIGVKTIFYCTRILLLRGKILILEFAQLPVFSSFCRFFIYNYNWNRARVLLNKYRIQLLFPKDRKHHVHPEKIKTIFAEFRLDKCLANLYPKIFIKKMFVINAKFKWYGAHLTIYSSFLLAYLCEPCARAIFQALLWIFCSNSSWDNLIIFLFGFSSFEYLNFWIAGTQF